MSFDPNVVKINRVYAALFREIEMVIRSKEDPSALFYGVIRLMIQFGAAEINVDQLFYYSPHCPGCIPDCLSILEHASPTGRSYLRRTLIDRGEFLQLQHIAELAGEPLAQKELQDVSVTLARRHHQLATERFIAFVNGHPDLSELDRRRLIRPLYQATEQSAYRF